MTQSLFDLGTAVGNVPAQYTAKRKRAADKATAAETTKGIMAGISEKDPAKLEAVAEQLLLADKPVKAMEIFQQAQVLKEKLKLEKEKETLERGELSLVKYATAAGMNLNDPKAREYYFRRAAIYGIDPLRASELFEKFAPDKKEMQVIAAGATLVDGDGNVIFSGPFKPSEGKAPVYKVIAATKLDPNIRVFKDGVEMQVIPIITGDSEADAAKRLAGLAKLVGIEQTLGLLMGTDFEASGISGALMSYIPGSNARDRSRLIKSLKANLGLESIAELKALSATGSTGLGQVSNIELDALQSAVAAIDVTMSEEAQKLALEKIAAHMQRAKNAMAGLLPKDTVEWNSPMYQAAGFAKSKRGEIYYSPSGPTGQRYRMDTTGKFVPL
jgi:hypothetical protein